MAFQNIHTKEMSLILSSDAKPRLKWTSDLHQRFVYAVNQLGGAEKATPKSLMRVMGIHGLTLYHLKSHLQKYRLGRSQQATHQQNNQEDTGEDQRSQVTDKIGGDGAKEQINENLQIAEALQMQMEVQSVQRKLHEQIEVQRHLQLRIEAQGKYLQSVLKKAQDTLSGYNSCSIDVERAKVQLSQLVSMVDSGCPSSSFSVLTESNDSLFKAASNMIVGHNGYSFESSLTSSESSGRKEETEINHEVNKKRSSVVLPLMEMHQSRNNDAENQASHRKRTKFSTDEGNVTEQSTGEKSGVERCGLLRNIDLNCKSQSDFDLSSKGIDLNC